MLEFSLGVACGAKKCFVFYAKNDLFALFLLLGRPQGQKVEAFSSKTDENRTPLGVSVHYFRTLILRGPFGTSNVRRTISEGGVRPPPLKGWGFCIHKPVTAALWLIGSLYIQKKIHQEFFRFLGPGGAEG